MRKLHYVSFALLLVALAFSPVIMSCSDDDDNNGGVTTLPKWTIKLSAQYQVPALTNRSETGTLVLTQVDNTTLQYVITINNLASTDMPTMAHFHVGDAITNGPVVFDFEPEFVGNTASGTIQVRASLVDSLKTAVSEIYFNVHSQQAPNGLVRGQVNKSIVFAKDVVLTGENQVAPVVTTATGLAILRLTSDNKLYSNVTVNNLESTDALTMAHIHLGNVGENGDIIIFLCHTINDFGMNMVSTLTSGERSSWMNNGTYVNVHTTTYPNGIIRGQLTTGATIPTNPGDPYEPGNPGGGY